MFAESLSKWYKGGIEMYRYKVIYNTNFWGARKASGYVIAKSKEEALTKLENRFGKIDYQSLGNSTVVEYIIQETDFIDL